MPKYHFHSAIVSEPLVVVLMNFARVCLQLSYLVKAALGDGSITIARVKVSAQLLLSVIISRTVITPVLAKLWAGFFALLKLLGLAASPKSQR